MANILRLMLKILSFLSVFCIVLQCLTTVEGKPNILQDLNKNKYSIKDAVEVPNSEFAHYTILKPRIYQGRQDPEATTQINKFLHHPEHLTIVLPVDGEELVLDLALNKQLIPQKYFQKVQVNGSHKITTISSKVAKLCEYTGKVRNKPNSWVALSNCDGLSGAIHDGINNHYIEKKKSGDGSEHFLYKHQDLLIKNITNGCTDMGTFENPQHFRFKRQTPQNHSLLKEPYSSNSDSRYIELLLVVDNHKYLQLNSSLENVEQYCKSVTNIINGIYSSLNIFVVLTGVIVWNERDEIEFYNDTARTLTEFMHYRQQKLITKHPNDNAQLITGRHFLSGESVGFNNRICTTEFSGGINTDNSSVISRLATTVAHIIGHNLGMVHDTENCDCPDSSCIMSAIIHPTAATQWSSCSRISLYESFSHGMDHCLKNIPKSLYQGPVCGNGFVEDEEDCDCGPPEFCKNKCCQAATCKFETGAKCATGKCCDLKTCSLRNAGIMCRRAASECDLPEACTGTTEDCPDDVHILDAEICDNGKGRCYQGHCGSYSQQCKLLWGATGEPASDECYKINRKGDKTGSCGYNRLSQTFEKCFRKDIMCGNLFCSHENKSLQYGLEASSILSSSSVNSNGTVLSCRNVVIDLGTDSPDPGFVPNGAPCARKKVCINQKCISVADVQAGRACPQNCYNNGYCNSLGHCHCDAGYLLPNCQLLAPGGSVDSGPIHLSPDALSVL